VQERRWSDDRLALVLDVLAQPEQWQRFETALNQRLIRVYQLQPQRVRLDSTTTSGYWSVSEEGLFQLGYSKDHRPDLPQLKVMLSALDPLGLPLVTQVVAGNAADDPLYLPAIKQVSQSLPGHGVLYVGDCKMAALSTRAYVQAQGDYYLCPLANTQMPDAELDAYLQPVWNGNRPLLAVHRVTAEGEDEVIAQGYEQCIELSSEVEGQSITWTERRLEGVLAGLARIARAPSATTVRLAGSFRQQQQKVEATLAARHAVRGAFAVDGDGTLAVGTVLERLAKRGMRGGGFDLLPGDLRLVGNGHLDFVVDQQPYVQGFAPVIQLFLARISQGTVVPFDIETSILLRRADVQAFIHTKSRFEGSSSRHEYPLRRG